MNACGRCKIEKPLSDFMMRKSRAKGATHMVYRTICRKCMNITQKKWYYANHEESKRQGRLNQAKQREVNGDRVREIRAECARKNNHYENARTRLREINKIKAVPKWADKKYMELWYKLAKIEEKRTGKKVHVDHIIPLKGKNVCGLHCEDNMQLLFADANFAKSNNFEV